MFVVIEGIDGCGKGTQAELLAEALRDDGNDVCLTSFPRYAKTTFGALVGEYLNGDFGTQVHPKLASMLYTLDRFEARDDLRSEIAVRDVVVCDRYTQSNVGHQCARAAPEEAEALAAWLDKVEYGLFEMPVPDLVICLDLPVEMAVTLIAKKKGREYTKKDADLHEADLEHLRAARGWYSRMAEKSRSTWHTVPVHRNGHIRPAEQVHKDVQLIVDKAMGTVL